jgi:adenylate cyclase class 2
MGMVRTLTFEKRRATWMLDGCTVVLDEVPHLGHFMEIEGAGEDAVTRLARTLGLTDADLEPHTYSRLLTRYCDAHGLDGTRITF